MATGDKYVLAIDLGTSGPKVALVSSRGEIVDHEFRPTKLILLPDGGAEQDPDDWWNTIKEASRQLLQRNQNLVSDIVAVSPTAQWSGTVAVDKDGSHLMNAVIWMDSRGKEQVKKITGGIISVQGYGVAKLLPWLYLTGGIPGHSGKDPIAHILWIKSARPDIYRQTHKFLEPINYLGLRFTGRFLASYDSIALHWLTNNRDLSNIHYCNRLLKLTGIPREKLPDLAGATDILGTIKPEVAKEFGLKEDVRVVVGTPDMQSASIGSGAIEDYAGYLYIGTSSWLTCHVPGKKLSLSDNMTTLPSAIPGRYLIANTQECAGASLTWLKNILNLPQPNGYTVLDQIAIRTSAGSGGVIFTPWLYGERTPVENSTVRGGFNNLSYRNNARHLIRSVFEGVAFNSRWLLGCVEKFAKRRFETLNLSGGGAKSDIWCQIHADVLNRRIGQVETPILANIRGAGLLALAALGKLSLADASRCVRITRTYEPNPENRRIYDKLFQEFLEIYKSNRKIHARLNGFD